MALVHPIEPLENPPLMRCRNPDSIVSYDNADMILRTIDDHIHCAVLPVILDGIITQIVDHFIQYPVYSPDCCLFPEQIERDIPLLCLYLQAPQYLLRQFIQIHLFLLVRDAPAVQLRNHDDIIHQSDQPLCLLINGLGEIHHGISSRTALLHQLREPGDGCKRRLQFMGDIGSKLPAQRFPLFLLRNVENNDNRADHLFILEDRIGNQAVAALILNHCPLCLPAVQRFRYRFAEILRPTVYQHISLCRRRNIQESACSWIVGQKTGILVYGQETLTHIFRDQTKLVLLLAGIRQLSFYQLFLSGDLGKKRSQFLIGIVFLRILQIQHIDRFYNRAGYLR